MDENKVVKQIASEIQRISTELGLPHASFLSKAQFMAKAKRISEWDLRKFGGFSSIVKHYFPLTGKDLSHIELAKQQASHISSLEKQYGKWGAFEQQLTASLVKHLATTKIEPTILDKKETKKYLDSNIVASKFDNTKRSIVTIWSDQHFGTNVDEEELAGKNKFSWTIGARRLGMLCEQIASYKVERRNLHEELVVILLGDNIGGIIHNQEGPDYDLITFQVNGTLSYYIQALAYLKSFYPKIRVLCQPGNHGRMQHKNSKDRAFGQKYDSYENIIFYALSQKFANDDVVEVSVQKAPYIDADIQGHRIFATHGDTVWNVGNVGKAINLASMEHQIHRVNAEELAKKKKPFSLFASGHVHHPVITQVGPGIHVVINGCLIGTDSFALGVGIFSSAPSQTVFEVTKQFSMGDSRLIYVDKADSNTHFEQIIKPYQYELTASKLKK